MKEGKRKPKLVHFERDRESLRWYNTWDQLEMTLHQSHAEREKQWKVEIIWYFRDQCELAKKLDYTLDLYLTLQHQEKQRAKDWDEWTWYVTWNHLVPDYQGTKRSWELKTVKGEHNCHLRLPWVRQQKMKREKPKTYIIIGDALCLTLNAEKLTDY